MAVTNFQESFARIDVDTLVVNTSATLPSTQSITTANITTANVTNLKVGASGTSLASLNLWSDTVASGGATKTITAAGVTASTKIISAVIVEDPTNDVAISSVVPGTDQIVVTLTGDPGASNADIQVVTATVTA